MSTIITYLFLSFIIILLNVPFGYLRHGTKKFSFYWFLYIHLPVPFIFLIRSALGVELSFVTAPLLFVSYFLGQFLGKKIKAKTTGLFASIDFKDFI